MVERWGMVDVGGDGGGSSDVGNVIAAAAAWARM